jgi:hypothetical protein
MDMLCVICGRTAGTAYVCQHCANIGTKLYELADLWPELETTIAHLNVTPGGGTGDDPNPAPADHGASTNANTIANTITTIARDIAETRGITLLMDGRTGIGPLCVTGWGCRHQSCQDIRKKRRAQQIPALCRWLATQTTWIRHQSDAAETIRDVEDAHALTVRTVDRAAPKVYYGPCNNAIDDQPCGTHLYAAQGRSTIRCPRCDATHDADARKTWLLGQAQDHHAHAELIGRALAALGLPSTPASIRGLARHGHITSTGMDGHKPLYRLGDVLTAMAAIEKRRAERLKAAAARRVEAEYRRWLRSQPTQGPACAECRHRSCTATKSAHAKEPIGVAT